MKLGAIVNCSIAPNSVPCQYRSSVSTVPAALIAILGIGVFLLRVSALANVAAQSRSSRADHRVTGSSPAGCESSSRADLQAIIDLQKWVVLEVSSSFYLHFSCSESAGCS